ncbi:MAG: ParB/RepB/Spo0J family partition protein [Deltaproteobacteria bacterium]|jgi:ParB family chromosome partitioning protein|nr:ParB/RepB/Spo0J family partition protein [Deltaproteobacteria bacterium]
MKNFDNFNYKSDAVAKFKEIYGKEEEFKEISLSSITVLPQVRTEFNSKAISELAESIQKIGVIQPIVVVNTGKGYKLVIGERRFRASTLAGKSTIPARIFKALSEKDITALQLIENIHREDLKPMELAQSYKKLQESGISTRDIADIVKKSQAYIVNTLKLLTLDDDLKDKIAKEGLSPSKAVEYSKLTEPAKKDVDIKTIKRDELRNIRKDLKPIKDGEENIKSQILDTGTENPYQTSENQEQGPEVGIDEIIKEFNSALDTIRIKNIGLQAISIWAEKPETLFDIIAGLKKKYCK